MYNMFIYITYIRCHYAELQVTQNLKIAVQHIQHTSKKTYVRCALRQVGQVTFGATLKLTNIELYKTAVNSNGTCQRRRSLLDTNCFTHDTQTIV